MRVLYFDCIAGISGDMALGALIDAGADVEEIKRGLASLPVDAFTIDIGETESHGLRATRVNVETASAGVIRTYASIRALLDDADLPEDARRVAQRVFRRLAEAEALVHRKEVDTVTFHEVGAVDSIVDVTGTALALTTLGVERAFSSAVPTGMGMTRSEHGAMPIPAPAVVELLRGAPLYSKGVAAELVTPTGAAILSALVEGYGELPPMRVGAVGYGAGSQHLDFPNVLRVIIGDDENAPERILRSVDAPNPQLSESPGADPGLELSGELVLESNVDDLEPELYEFVIERLLAAGAQDAWLTPIVMKKGRPAVTVSVLCSRELEQEMRRILFRETGTLGVRTSPVAKTALAREILKVETSYGPVAVKVGTLEDGGVTLSPEFEDCARLAREFGVPAREVHQEAVRRAREEIDRRS
jgi:uncharacterized protein (TIGR00299 family) protein